VGGGGDGGEFAVRGRQQPAAGAVEEPGGTEVIDAERIRAYLDGRLEPGEAEVVARELDTLPEAELERLFAASGHRPAASSQRPAATGQQPTFTPAPRAFHEGAALGSGATGAVSSAEDRLLGRAVALKKLRPRGADEPLDAFLVRAAAFRREAALTASLEHPGVVPVHDVGSGALGEPAFAMKRLDGRALAGLLGEGLPPARAADIAIRVADALGFAHASGVVHRDLKPDHVWIGLHGEVTVIDWGLAARCGEDPRRCGTLGWMSPEQETGASADPRMDVWAIGGLLDAMLGHRAPRGLAAVVRRCRAPQPGDRYGDGAAVAADLRRWLELGLSQAEQPGALVRLWTALRRSPGLAASAVLGLVLGALAVGLPLARGQARLETARAAVAELASATPTDTGSIAALRRRLAPILAEHPRLPEAALAAARLDAAARVLEDATRQRLLADTLDALDRSWRVRGPWPEEPAQLAAALELAGVFAMRPGQPCPAESHPEAARLRRALIQLQRARLGAGQQPEPRIPAVLAMCRDPAWSALGRVIAGAVLLTHDLAAPPGADLEAALAMPATAELVLATFGPDARLVEAARGLLAADPGAFWPRICLARAAVRRADWAEARLHALIALGRESASLWPRLVLGYAALATEDWGALLAESTFAAAANPDHLEAGTMQAIALARLGRREDAAARFAAIAAAGHLRWHQAHRDGHPMEALADAAEAAGLALGDAVPRLTPLVPVR